MIIVGDGSQRHAAERAAAEAAVGDRVVFVGAASGDALVSLYAGALGIVYVPFDEDYGYVTLEAFLAAKPVITAADSGGTLEFVRDGENGFVCPAEPEAVGRAIARLVENPDHARQLGERGRMRAAEITWDGVVEQLVG
jgi:glycosyltransferase involved in cell wall biosynthesis